MLKQLGRTMFAGAMLAAGAVALFGQNPVTDKLATGTYIVYAQSPQIWRFKVDPKTMNNVTVTGHFSVTQGTPKNIEVYVFDEQNYSLWKDDDGNKRKSAKPEAAIARTAEGNVNAKLSEEGYHYLVISDRYEYEGKKTIVADIKLQYEKR